MTTFNDKMLDMAEGMTGAQQTLFRIVIDQIPWGSLEEDQLRHKALALEALKEIVLETPEKVPEILITMNSVRVSHGFSETECIHSDGCLD